MYGVDSRLVDRWRRTLLDQSTMEPVARHIVYFPVAFQPGSAIESFVLMVIMMFADEIRAMLQPICLSLICAFDLLPITLNFHILPAFYCTEPSWYCTLTYVIAHLILSCPVIEPIPSHYTRYDSPTVYRRCSFAASAARTADLFPRYSPYNPNTGASSET